MSIKNTDKPSWTPEQSEAIRSRNKTLLVSAAAGSGKTAVLTARIISRLTDAESPADISRLCVVTFTRAAAAELKERIAKALNAALRDAPGNRRLERQLTELGKAHISTIHSFCYEIIRSNFHKLGLTAAVRIADAAEADLLCREVMNDTLDFFYSAEGTAGAEPVIGDFGAFAETFVTDRDDKLTDIFIALYRRLAAYPEGVGFLDGCIENLKNGGQADYLATPWGEAAARSVSRGLEHYSAVFESALEYISGDEKLAKNYHASFDYDKGFAERLLFILTKKNYGELRRAAGEYSPVSLGRGVRKADQTVKLEFFKETRQTFSKYVKKLCETLLRLEPETIAALLLRSTDICEKAGVLLREYERRLAAEKKRRGLIDYSDLERLTLRLFYDGEGRTTEIARAVSERFDEIYIDEYQDINALQDMLFRAFARPGGLFMVGDIKQSIYGFRGAAPDIFARYRDDFCDGRVPGSGAIFLSDNFRCDRHIIEYVNAVSGCLFTHNSGRVRYYAEDALKFSKRTGAEPFKVRTVLIESRSDDEVSREAEYVAREVRKLILSGVRPSEITLLFRSTKSSAKVFEDALARLAIPCFNNTSGGFFENAEVLLALCILNCVDNPSRDIYLAGALRSPVYGFTMDELAGLREEYPDGTLYDALTKHAETRGSPKEKYFLELLVRYREYAASQPVSRLLWYIYRDTGLLASASEGGSGRGNLMLLYEYARKFEAGSFKGLYNFILYVNDIIEQKEPLDTASAFSESGDTVKLMTIHQSKGLEFPVCFLCDAARGFNRSASAENLQLDRALGLTMKLRDGTGLAYIDTPMRQASLTAGEENGVDEEMRVLYVALTRARERLYVTAGLRDPEKLLETCRADADFVSCYTMSCSPSYMKWILTALDTQPDSDSFNQTEMIRLTDESETVKLTNTPVVSAETPKNREEYLRYRKLFSERFAYRYPYARQSKLPAKLTVSKLYPGLLDDADASYDGAKDISEALKPSYRRPLFLEPERAEAAGSERGTATHVFMQFCDFRLLEAHGAAEELARLTAERFITASTAGLVDRPAVERFMRSNLYELIKSAGKLHRELRFNINLPAGQFTRDESFAGELAGETVLVQGVVDCLIEARDGRLILVDYKTDHFTREELSEPGRAEELLRERYENQLSYYKTACEKLTCKRVDETLIYSFSLGKTVKL